MAHDDKLLDPIAHIVHILPNYLQDIIISDSIYNILLANCDDHSIKNQLTEISTSIDHSLISNTIDQNKYLVLSMMFGASVTRAIDIVLSDQIQCCLPNGVQVVDYLHDPMAFPTTQFKISLVPKSTTTTELLLLKLGYTLVHGRLVRIGSSEHTLQEQRISTINNTGEYNMVDLYNWYCDCNEYLQQYTNEMKPVEINGNSNLVECLLSQLKSVILEPIPVCCHILAVLIVLINSEKLQGMITMT